MSVERLSRSPPKPQVERAFAAPPKNPNFPVRASLFSLSRRVLQKGVFSPKPVFQVCCEVARVVCSDCARRKAWLVQRVWRGERARASRRPEEKRIETPSDDREFETIRTCPMAPSEDDPQSKSAWKNDRDTRLRRKRVAHVAVQPHRRDRTWDTIEPLKLARRGFGGSSRKTLVTRGQLGESGETVGTTRESFDAREFWPKSNNLTIVNPS